MATLILKFRRFLQKKRPPCDGPLVQYYGTRRLSSSVSISWRIQATRQALQCSRSLMLKLADHWSPAKLQPFFFLFKEPKVPCDFLKIFPELPGPQDLEDLSI
uniref:Uncharacterized protein n=1 Tax=Oryza sativa subsp. japonica TaxID=39947 RepID=Q6ZHB8_ORYSJ|nr:hypothetical protein [Oryza sativa Japonica Group]